MLASFQVSDENVETAMNLQVVPGLSEQCVNSSNTTKDTIDAVTGSTRTGRALQIRARWLLSCTLLHNPSTAAFRVPGSASKKLATEITEAGEELDNSSAAARREAKLQSGDNLSYVEELEASEDVSYNVREKCM